MEYSALNARHRAATDDLAELERSAGIAILDDADFDASLITQKRNELAALSAAEAEAIRRDRASRQAELAAAKAAARAEVSGVLAAHGSAMKDVRKKTEALIASLSTAVSTAARLRELATILDSRPPAAIDPFGLPKILSRLIAGEMMKLGGRCHFGDLSWPSVGAPAWDDHFDKRVSPTFEAMIEETTNA